MSRITKQINTKAILTTQCHVDMSGNNSDNMCWAKTDRLPTLTLYTMLTFMSWCPVLKDDISDMMTNI